MDKTTPTTGRSSDLGNYTLLQKIGEGGMGMVFKARHKKMGRIVALKVLPGSVARSVRAVRRFQREVEACARLNHPNIVTAYDADEANGRHFLVMEFVEGVNLHKLARTKPLSVVKTLDYIIQAARGLEYAHQHAVIHRDIKPSNLILSNDGTVKILDLGLATMGEEEDDLTHTGSMLGTVDFMSPEQTRDTKNVDQRADIYSLGCTLFYLLTSKPVFEGDTLVNKIMNHQQKDPPSLSDFRPDIPPKLDRIFKTMVAKERDERYSNMTEVLRDLESVQPTIDGCDDPTFLPSTRTFSVQVTPKKKKPRQFLIPALTMAFLFFAGVIITIKTKDGTYTIKTDDPNPVVEVAADKEQEATPKAATADRSIAEWVLAEKGKVQVAFGNESKEISKTQDLPADDFILNTITLNGVKRPMTAFLRRLKTLSNLEHLVLINCDVRNSDLPLIAEIETLKGLSLAGCPISDVGLTAIGKMTWLTGLNLGGTPVTDAGIEKLKGLGVLQGLELSDTKVMQLTFLKNFPNLKFLNLFHTPIADNSLEEIKPLNKLSELYLSQTTVTDMAVGALRMTLQNCKIER